LKLDTKIDHHSKLCSVFKIFKMATIIKMEKIKINLKIQKLKDFNGNGYLQGVIFMFVCTTVLYEYMNSVRNDVCNLFVNTHVLIKIYRDFYHCVLYIANEGRHVRINKI
jgi:GH25 family lysozyme M1 (1,4-beta-N-acetylmuramidase)